MRHRLDKLFPIVSRKMRAEIDRRGSYGEALMVSAGWALELRGSRVDLDDVREKLKPPFDPWVEEYGEGGENMLLLRSNAWKGLASTGDMMAEAARLIDHINGALLLEDANAQLISHGITLCFGEDGGRLPVVIAAKANITLKGFRVRARGVVGAGSPEEEPSASIMQVRLQKADKEPIMSDLLTFITRADNWFDLFKAMELVERLIGGEARAQAISSEWKRVRQTANRHRHAPSPKHTLPRNPPQVPEARAVLLAVASTAVGI